MIRNNMYIVVVVIDVIGNKYTNTTILPKGKLPIRKHAFYIYLFSSFFPAI